MKTIAGVFLSLSFSFPLTCNDLFQLADMCRDAGTEGVNCQELKRTVTEALIVSGLSVTAAINIGNFCESVCNAPQAYDALRDVLLRDCKRRLEKEIKARREP